MKQAVKKKTIEKPSIASIKSKLNLNVEGVEDLNKSNTDKPLEFIPMPSAFSEAIHLPGIPAGYLTLISGWSNTGKSTLKNALIASCINNGILPVIFETETSFDFSYAIDCGMKATPIYGDVEVEEVDYETGEVSYKTERRVINHEGDFLYYDHTLLSEVYGKWDYAAGKEVSKKRKVAVLEDIAHAINDILDMQDDGEIQQPICFIWDSIGSIPSYKSYASKTGNNMFDAGALSSAFNIIINNRIPSSRKVSSPYTNTMVCVNKIWNDSMNSMGGVPSIELKGGKAFFYSARCMIHMGGVAKASTKKLTATAGGQTYNYGIITKIKVTKNHLPSPYNVTYEGEVACVHNGLCSVNSVDEYKKTYLKDILKKLKDMGSNTEDVKFSEVEGED